MILVGILVAACNGRIGSVGTAAIDSSKDAVMLCITMLGVMSMWTGLMNIAKKAGIIDRLTKGLRPVLAFLFPTVPEDHPANEYIAANIISNVLGLGWAATPMGLKAMEQLAQLNHGSHRASTDMCTFLIINISSLQLIPVNIIAYRSQYLPLPFWEWDWQPHLFLWQQGFFLPHPPESWQGGKAYEYTVFSVGLYDPAGDRFGGCLWYVQKSRCV